MQGFSQCLRAAVLVMVCVASVQAALEAPETADTIAIGRSIEATKALLQKIKANPDAPASFFSGEVEAVRNAQRSIRAKSTGDNAVHTDSLSASARRASVSPVFH
mmetsp:Transcript_14661/g.22774  ORF Transcript_14661/g.22774 Transcript_14661/m.22774 type:complete len:105 (+) Transcript_14661:120-434(+)